MEWTERPCCLCNEQEDKSVPGQVTNIRILFLILVSLGAGACQAPATVPAQSQYVDTRGAALHAVQNERLRAIMGEFNALMFEQMYTELELDRQRMRKARAIADAAAALNKTINELPGVLSSLQLTPEEQDIFRGLAQELQDQASQLEEYANRGEIETLRPMVLRMNTTCNACHSLFRGPRNGSSQNRAN